MFTAFEIHHKCIYVRYAHHCMIRMLLHSLAALAQIEIVTLNAFITKTNNRT